MDKKNSAKVYPVNTRKVKKGITFSPYTRVRNQYESVHPETGRLQINHNNYKVNATNDDKMPGYTMHNKKFKPHSKSVLQTATTQLKEMKKKAETDPTYMSNLQLSNLNTGWGPALSSVGNAPPTNMRAARSNMSSMKDFFGNAWTNAEVEREKAKQMRLQMDSKAELDYQKRVRAVEKDFVLATGMDLPGKMLQDKELQLAKLKRMPKLTDSEYYRLKSDIEYTYLDYLKSIPQTAVNSYSAGIASAKRTYEEQLKAALVKSSETLKTVRRGTPYPAYVKKTLANRLRNAQAKYE